MGPQVNVSGFEKENLYKYEQNAGNNLLDIVRERNIRTFDFKFQSETPILSIGTLKYRMHE